MGQGCLLRDSRVCIFRGVEWAGLESLGRGEGQREIREREGRKQAGERGGKEGREEGETEGAGVQAPLVRAFRAAADCVPSPAGARALLFQRL